MLNMELPHNTSSIKRPSMNLAYLNSPDFSFFSDDNKLLNYMIEQLQSDTYLDSEHG